MSIEGLTHELTGLQEGGVLQLTETAYDKLVGEEGAFPKFIKEIEAVREKANGLQSIFYPGDFESANALKRDLTLNFLEILEFLDKYIEYLYECENTVKATCNLILAEG